MEVKGGIEGGGVVWHGGVKVAEHVWTREWCIELLSGETRVLDMPEFEWEMATEAIRRAREEEDEERTE